MVICPNCQHPVDETATDTCPICKSSIASGKSVKPVQESPEPATVASGANSARATLPTSLNSQGNVRNANLNGDNDDLPAAKNLPPPSLDTQGYVRKMTLSGEYIDVPNPMSNQAVRPGTIPLPSGSMPARRPGPRPFEGEQPKQASKSGRFVAIFLVVLLVLGSIGGYAWWTHRTNPQDQAQKYLNAVKAQDWTTVYNLTDLSAQDLQKYPDASSFSAALKGQPLLGIILKSLSNAQLVAQPPSSNDGHTAVVPMKMSLTFNGQTFNHTVNLNMINRGGFWKIKRTAGMGM